MRVVVPDASVILKWVVPDLQEEQDMEAALAIRELAAKGKLLLKVPSLWIYEVGNLLTRRFAAHALSILESLMAFDMAEGIADGNWLDQTVKLTQRYNVTFYDAAYHALALTEKGIFVTADTDYVRKAVKAGAVLHLSEWSTPD